MIHASVRRRDSGDSGASSADWWGWGWLGRFTAEAAREPYGELRCAARCTVAAAAAEAGAGAAAKANRFKAGARQASGVEEACNRGNWAVIGQAAGIL